MPIEVEARTLQEVHEVLEVLQADPGCINRIMLDNMTRLDPTMPGPLLLGPLLRMFAHVPNVALSIHRCTVSCQCTQVGTLFIHA